MNRFFAILLLVFGWGIGAAKPAEATLPSVVHDGSEPAVELAAREVRRYLYLRTGSLLDMAVHTSLPPSGDLVVVATAGDPILGDLDGLPPPGSAGGFVLKSLVHDGRQVLVIRGDDPAATLQGAYRYAEHLGVGFGLALDAIPDAPIALDISGIDEAGVPRFATRGIQPYHDFPAGPDFWNTADYLAVVSQLPKLGMNFLGLHTYTRYNSQWDQLQDMRRGPEPAVWIGLPEDVAADGTVQWSYPATWAHTHREQTWAFDTWDTDQFHGGASELFPTNGYGADVLGETLPTDVPSSNAVFNAVGAMFDEAFRHARVLGVATAVGTELPLGLEPAGAEIDEPWVRGMPAELQARLVAAGRNPADPDVVKDVYRGIFERILKTHPLDYYWLWSYEIWSEEGVTPGQVAAFETDIGLAQEALAELGNPFQLAHAGWKLGTVANPAEFEDVLPPEAPFFSLWGSATGFDQLSAARVKWPATWLEYDWGLAQPQLALYRVHEDAVAAESVLADGFIAEHWRTRILGPNVHAMKNLAWSYGPGGTSLPGAIPADVGAWMDEVYLDWATRQFGGEVAAAVAEILAEQDWENLPAAIGWAGESPDGYESPAGILPNPTAWAIEQQRFAFVGTLEALRPQVVGAGNRDRFDYWLAAMQALRAMAEYGCVRDDFEKAMSAGRYAAALTHRRAMARLFEELMVLQVAKATNASDLGEIVNLEILNWKQLMMNKWDAALVAGLGGAIPGDANPSGVYTGDPWIRVMPVRTQLYADETLELEILAPIAPTNARVHYRPLGSGAWKSVAVEHEARGVYRARLPLQQADFEYYVEAMVGGQSVRFPVTAPALNQSVVVLSGCAGACSPVCGNGVPEEGEACDDGLANGGSASCCAADCSWKSDGPASCDGNICTGGDRCEAGVCIAGACRSGEACSVCGGRCSSDVVSCACEF